MKFSALTAVIATASAKEYPMYGSENEMDFFDLVPLEDGEEAPKMFGAPDEMPTYLLEDTEGEITEMFGSPDEMPEEINHHPKVLAAEIEEEENEGKLTDLQFTKKFYFALWNSMVKGWYRTTSNSIVGEECMGSWMDEGMKNLDNMLNESTKSSFPTAAELKSTFDFGVDVVYKNNEKCNVYKVMSESMIWCSGNVGTCMYGEGFMKRLTGNSLPIMMKAREIFMMLMDTEAFKNDQDSIDKMGKFVEDISYITSTLIGFEGKIHSEPSDLTIDQLQINIDNAVKVYQKAHPKPVYHAPKMPHMSMRSFEIEMPHMMQMPQMQMPQMQMPRMQMPRMQMPQMHMMNLAPQSPFGFRQSSFNNFGLF